MNPSYVCVCVCVCVGLNETCCQKRIQKKDCEHCWKINEIEHTKANQPNWVPYTNIWKDANCNSTLIKNRANNLHLTSSLLFCGCVCVNLPGQISLKRHWDLQWDPKEWKIGPKWLHSHCIQTEKEAPYCMCNQLSQDDRECFACRFQHSTLICNKQREPSKKPNTRQQMPHNPNRNWFCSRFVCV